MSVSKVGQTGIKIIGPLKKRTDKELIMYLVTQYALHEVLIEKLQKEVEDLKKR